MDGPACTEDEIERVEGSAVYAGGFSVSSSGGPMASNGFCFFSSAMMCGCEISTVLLGGQRSFKLASGVSSASTYQLALVAPFGRTLEQEFT